MQLLRKNCCAGIAALVLQSLICFIV